MDDTLARQLAALTRQFYARTAPSFSATRQQPWDGWEQLWGRIAPLAEPHDLGRPLRVLDVGCGNLRFERFLAQHAEGPVEAWGVDNCPALMAEGAAHAAAERGAAGRLAAHLVELDLAGALLDGAAPDALAARFGAPPADLAVAFGLFHHIPGAAARQRLMQALVAAVRPGGIVAVSLWQFACDPRLRAKAQRATARGRAQLGLPPLPAGDYLMGWQDDADAFRYCHHFAEEEVDALAAAAVAASPDATRAPSDSKLDPTTASSASSAISPLPAALTAREVARFSADGKPGNLNRYLVLQRTE